MGINEIESLAINQSFVEKLPNNESNSFPGLCADDGLEPFIGHVEPFTGAFDVITEPSYRIVCLLRWRAVSVRS